MVRVSSDRFEELVRQAMESLPDEFWNRLENVVVTVADEPTREQLGYHGLTHGETLFGLYEGVPLTERSSFDPPWPDKITIFHGPLERHSATEADLIAEVRDTVVHEVAHFFGIGDDRLHELGL